MNAVAQSIKENQAKLKNTKAAMQKIMLKWDCGQEFHWSQPKKWSEPTTWLMETGSFRALYTINGNGTYKMQKCWDEF